MLAIRLQRTGRKGHPMYRVIVQEAHRQPTSGRVVALLGNYNPHNKEVKFNKEQTELFLKNGAQPSERIVSLLVAEKITLPSWVQKIVTGKQKKIKNLEKLRRNRPTEEVEETSAEAEVSDEVAQENTEEVTETQVETVEEETSSEPEVAEEAPAEAEAEETPSVEPATEKEAK